MGFGRIAEWIGHNWSACCHAVLHAAVLRCTIQLRAMPCAAAQSKAILYDPRARC
jgi:hypothetical protein